jgi:predicted molibdopterin-dependent oxidoreductase YjgC
LADTVTLTIDGQTIEAQRGVPVLKAALDAGLYIPHFCFYEGLTVFAGCRLCTVEIEGMRGVPTACTTPVQDGMIVRTKSQPALDMQRGVMSFMLSDHPDRCLTCHRQEHCGIDGVCLRDAVVTYRCLTCAKNKRCEFQSGSEYLEMHRYPAPYYQETDSWYGPSHEEKPIRRDNPFIELDFNECILCTRCVRVCDEVRGLHVYELANKGPASQIDTVMGMPMQDVGCDFCGACIDVCPVASIMDRPSKWQALAQQETVTVCPHCGDGCQIIVETKRDKVLRVTPDKEGPTNTGFMCARGRWGLGFTRSTDRLTTPLIRKGDQLVPATWEEALMLVNDRLSTYQGDAVGVLGSSKATNEENFLLQKLARGPLGTQNVDHYTRIDNAGVVEDLLTQFGYAAMTNSLMDITNAHTLFIVGSNTAVTHPIAAWRARTDLRTHRGKLVLAHPRDTEMTQYADLWLRYRPGTEVALIGGILRAILDGGLEDKDFVASRTEGLDALRTSLGDLTVEQAASVTGVSVEDITAAATEIAQSGPTTILYDVGLLEFTENTDGPRALADLALLTGNIGKAGAGVAALRGTANDQGAWDMGLRPNLLPGYKPAPAGGRGLSDMVQAATAGTLKAMYVIQSDPVLDDPQWQQIAAGLDKLEFLVVQDHFLTATAQLADVVLPSCTFAEIEGTFTNTERRVQLLRAAMRPQGDARPGWWILHQLGNMLGGDFTYEHAGDVFEEIAGTVDLYRGMSYEVLDEGGIQWPCTAVGHPGTPILYTQDFARPQGKASFLPVRITNPAATSAALPLSLAVGRELIPYHQEVLERDAHGLPALLEQLMLRVHPEDAYQLGIRSGDPVLLTDAGGQSGEFTANIVEEVPQGTVYLTYPLIEQAADMLAYGNRDLVTKLNTFRTGGAKLEKAPVAAGR